MTKGQKGQTHFLTGDFNYLGYIMCVVNSVIIETRLQWKLKVRSRRLRPKAHILDDPLGNP